MVESFAFVLLSKALPIELRGLEEAEGSHDIGPGEGERILDRAVNMALRGEMDDAVNMLVLYEPVHFIEVADVGPDELVVRHVLDVLKGREIAGIGEFVDVDDVVVRIFVDEEPDYVGADEAGAAGYDDGTFIHSAELFLKIADADFKGVCPIRNIYSEGLLYLCLVKD